ncbi:MAG: InlB B-repeat-containing protein [Treponema sp.]|nr:InlB B-repeat-containing protein [Treponema sp.]
MKKSLLILKLVSALFAAGIFYSCDSGGGGGGSSGGGNSNSSGSTSISITIPSATSSSSDINLLGDFGIDDTKDFCYEIYFKKGTKEIARKEGTPGKTVTFDNVTYDTYDFFLDIYVDSNKITKLNTLDVLNKTVSASNNTVTFPDMSTSTYKNWYFVKNVDDLTRALSKIDEDSSYNASNTAILCLLATIEDPRADSVKGNSAIQLVENGYSFAAHLYTVTLPSDLPAGCSVTTNNADNKFAENVTVTLTVTAGTGYKFKSISYGVAGSASQNDPTEGEAGVTYTFPMPSNDVRVSARFIPVYTITYNLNGGGPAVGSDFESTARYTEENFDDDGVYALPTRDKISKTGYLFYGWYTESDFSGDKVEQIVSEDIGNKTFHARWIDSIYVKAGESSSNDGLTADTAVGTLAAAITKINDTATELEVDNFDWKIQVLSDLLTTQDMSASMVSANKIMVEGNSHTLDGSGGTDSVLKIINTPIPITIKNLKITGGSRDYNGSGLYVSGNNVDVTLGEGAKVTGNGNSGTNSAPMGGGVYVIGATFTVASGAEITNNNCTGTDSFGMVDGCGGGILYRNGSTVKVFGKVSGNIDAANADICAFSTYASPNEAGTLTLGEGAEVGKINLTWENTINVSGAPASSSIAVEIDPDYCTSGWQVLTGDIATIGANYTKFTITNTGLYNKIGSEGKLVAKDVDKFTLADFNALTFQPDAIPSKAFNNNADILNKVIVYKPITALDTYMVMKVTDLNSTSQFSGTAVLYNTLTGIKQPFTITNQSYINLITGGTDDGFVTTTASYFATESSGGVTFYNTEYSILE